MRELVTVCFEVLGLLCLSAGAALAAAGLHPQGVGVVAGGGSLLAGSFILAAAGKRTR